MSETKSERINVRLSPDAHETIRAAAHLQQQDVTSFVLGAAMERARAVLAEDRILRLTPYEVNQLEKALDSEPEVVPQLKTFLQRISDVREAASRLVMARAVPLGPSDGSLRQQGAVAIWRLRHCHIGPHRCPTAEPDKERQALREPRVPVWVSVVPVAHLIA
jgi:uncharacterized protein (DUF1778 family)